ncbi:hypothetical protein SLNSH_09295 [Alsobacter soli]|uniref:Uncharacterized protein n=1 Tax=Alsobacter soli TaxID=2109933 RepID=A0A2T1HUR8_9HYPH|nr:hypothetical protein [Alsobacter soli]PSC05381.1 hypothetical protein SLNSH_09295 [Alsobacter soli]
MTTVASQPHREHSKLGDEAFMSAEDLRGYMNQMTMAEAMAEVTAMEKAEQAQKELVKTLSKPVELTPEFVEGLRKRLASRLKDAARKGESEIMVMRFPNALCTDGGRAINNAEETWPETLTGRPRQAYEIWRDRLRPAGYKLKAMIIDWPRGMPGDVGMFLSWSDSQLH